jgi:capsular polysaccharide biosynthesis protein
MRFDLYPERVPESSFETSKEDYALSLEEILRTVRRRLLTILSVAFLITGITVGFALLQPPVYEASTEMLVGQEQNPDAQVNLASDVQGLQQITLTVVEAVNSRVVAEAVTQEMDLKIAPDTFLENLSVEQVGETQFIQISYRDLDPERAQEIADTVAEVTAERISEVSPNSNAITATTWQAAAEPESPVSPNPVRNGILALALGTMLGVGLAFLREYLDDGWRTPEEVEQFSGVPIFGVVPEFKISKFARNGRG